MKTLKFRAHLIGLILNKNKTITWRLFDDKNISPGDSLSFLDWETNKKFAQAIAMSIQEKSFKELTKQDWQGHEKFDSAQEMYKTYSKYYNRTVDENTKVKIIKFKLTNQGDKNL